MSAEFEFDWKTRGEVSLAGKGWLPAESPKAIIALIHGFGEHIGRYEHLARFYNLHEIAVIGFDLYGHGKSGGKRGYIPDYQLLLENIGEFLSLLNEKFSDVPIILYGHSMGGNLVANFILRYPSQKIKAAIITSPWLRLAKEPPFLKVMAGRIISSFYPQFTDSADLDVSQLSADPTVGKAYLADPLVHNKMSATLFLGVSDAGHQVLQNADMLSIPTLLMHGEADRITSFDASKQFAELVPDSTITTRWWPEGRHEMHNEVNKDEFFEFTLSWLEKTIQS